MSARRWLALLTAALMTMVLCAPARAVCVDGTLLSAIPANSAYPLKYADIYQKIVVSRPYWSGFVVLLDDPATDYDTYAFANPNGGAAPFCFSNTLASSVNAAGRTDFVVGDFNHDPLGTYYMQSHCYAGTCGNGSSTVGIFGWRDGDNLAVNAAPLSVTVGPTSFGDQMLHLYDVYLNAGTRYYFRFTNTGPNDIKMCLFRNTTNGVYWAGRNAAEFETTAYQSYLAPSSGYYGVAVVTDRRYNATSTYTLAVNTDPNCQFAPELANDVPVGMTTPQTVGYFRATQTQPYWMAVGNRMQGGDWDLYAGPPSSGDPNDGCIASLDAESTLYPPSADVIASDFNYGATLPYTEAFRATRYAGTSGATIQMDRGPAILELNGPKVTGSLAVADVVRIWDLPVNAGSDVGVEIKPFGAAIKAMAFERAPLAPRWYNRAAAMLETASTGKYTPLTGGFDAVAIVKDDELPGSYLIHAGICAKPTMMATQIPEAVLPNAYLAFVPPDTNWMAVSVHSPSTDWDLQQFGAAAGSTWPDCFGAPGARSEANNMTDFVIGDFHHMPRDTQYVHAYQFTANVADQARTMWDGGRGTLTVNAPASVQAMNGFHDQIFCYDVRLQASIPYTFEFSRSGGADAHLLLFRNPGAAAYWAPRSAAEFSTIANQPYTAPTTGAYGVVVIKDNDDLTGGFSLRVSSAVLAVEGSGLPAPTRLDRISPNPARGALRIAYSNAGVTPARFEVLDAAGRVVAHLGETNASRGAAEVVWDRRGLNGAKAPAGLYFVRMLAGGHVVDSRKVALIE